ncbi:MAG: prephenate dehydrogenase/arogenate dehydrogenase family protein [Desulfobacterales bacterium]
MIGIIGFGRFSALMVRYLRDEVAIRISTRRDKREEITSLGALQVPFEEVCRLPVVILSVPISAMEETLHRMAPLARSDALVIDVCSVKTYPVKWMREILPESTSLLATHPMFGPDSAADSLSGRKIVVCRERIGRERYGKIKDFLTSKGLIVMETSPEEHDRQIAASLSLTHFLGRSLAEFGAAPLDIDTEGYKRLLRILEVTQHDTWELFRDMHAYNPYAKGVRSDFMGAIEKINDLLEGKRPLPFEKND